MKKILLVLALSITALVSAQVPQGISYQAIAYNGTSAVVNGNVGLRLSVLNGSASGTAVYVETHVKTTNAQGLFNLVIGQGTAVSGTFAGINWATGAKFLKVEMDAAGGTNYALVGTTQLLSSPYAMVAGSLVLAPGQGITLTSPNGTPYTVSVNDAGELSLPTSGTNSSLPTSFYLCGSFNGFNPATALQMGNGFVGYKYFTGGSQIKFTASNTAGATLYGQNGNGDMVPNGAAYNIDTTGFYFLYVSTYTNPDTNQEVLYLAQTQSIAPSITIANGSGTAQNATYNTATNVFSIVLNGITTGSKFYFEFPSMGNTNVLGDNLGDGTVESGGTLISGFPGVNSTPKNYRVDLTINFNGAATYTITQI